MANSYDLTSGMAVRQTKDAMLGAKPDWVDAEVWAVAVDIAVNDGRYDVSTHDIDRAAAILGNSKRPDGEYGGFQKKKELPGTQASHEQGLVKPGVQASHKKGWVDFKSSERPGVQASHEQGLVKPGLQASHDKGWTEFGSREASEERPGLQASHEQGLVKPGLQPSHNRGPVRQDVQPSHEQGLVKPGLQPSHKSRELLMWGVQPSHKRTQGGGAGATEDLVNETTISSNSESSGAKPETGASELVGELPGQKPYSNILEDQSGAGQESFEAILRKFKAQVSGKPDNTDVEAKISADEAERRKWEKWQNVADILTALGVVASAANQQSGASRFDIPTAAMFQGPGRMNLVQAGQSFRLGPVLRRG